MERAGRWLAILVVAGLSIVVSACGSGGGSTSAPTTVSGSGSAQVVRGAIGRAGSEATSAQARPIEAALHRYLAALAASEWDRACSSLAASVRHRKSVVARLSHMKPPNCTGIVRLEAKTFQPAVLAKAHPSSIRIQESFAYLLFDKASAGVETAIGMRREGGVWKVVDSPPVPLPS